MRGASLPGTGQQTGQGGEDRGDADLGGARGGDRQTRDDGGGRPGGDGGEHGPGQEKSADTAQNRLAGRAPGTAQEARQDDGHGYEEGRQALDGLEGEDEDLTQDGCESILHIEGDAGGRLVGVGR